MSLENAKVARAQQPLESSTSNNHHQHHHHWTTQPRSTRASLVPGRTDGCTNVASDRPPRSTIGEHANQPNNAAAHLAKSQIQRVNSKPVPSKLKSKITAVKTSPTGRKASSEGHKSSKTKSHDSSIKQQRSSETKQSRVNSKTKHRDSSGKVGVGSNKRKSPEAENRVRKPSKDTLDTH